MAQRYERKYTQAQNSLKNNFNQRKINRHLEYIDGKISDYLEALGTIKGSNYTKSTKLKKTNEIDQKLAWCDQKYAEYLEKEQQLKVSGEKQISTTDPDAKAMITHRKNIKLGYNIQAVADSKYNMLVDVWTGGVNDMYELSEAGIRSQNILGIKKIDLLADKGYHNGVELGICERRGVRPFVSPKLNASIKDVGFRKEDFVFNPFSALERMILSIFTFN